MAILPLPPSGVAFIDPITGGVSVQWQNYLLSLSTISGGFAPLDAEYWVSTSNAQLTNETNLGALTTGYLKLTVAAGSGTPSTVTFIPGSDVSGSALTKTDDTNVTLTLGGTPTTALLRATSLTLGWTGTLAHGRGGTDVTSPGAAGNLLTSDGSNWTSAAPATAGTVTHTGTLTATALVVGNGGVDISTNGNVTIDATSNFLSSATQGRCQAFNSAAQVLTTGSFQALTFDSEDYDVGTFHSIVTNTSRFTIPTGGDGFYLFVGSGLFASAATGVGALLFAKNGTGIYSQTVQPLPVAVGISFQVTAFVPLVATDFIELTAFQNSGGNLNFGSAGRSSAAQVSMVKLW